MRRCRVAFLHPDLGLGGAERLVVDAAVELCAAGHTVDMYTAYYDPQRCFDETRSGAFDVIVAGGWFPRSIFGRCVAACAILRCMLAALYLAARVWSGNVPDYDVVIVDQVAAVVPLLRMLLPGMRVLFYCHFPDLLLSQRASWLKSLYRLPLDALEEASTGAADRILVNSNFTAGVFGSTFRRLQRSGVVPGVLYPAVPIPPDSALQEAAAAWRGELDPEVVAFIGQHPMLLSINRFERKKGIGLALTALKELQQRAGAAAAGGGNHTNSSSNSSSSKDSPVLVVAGGYDVRLAENREHLQELQQLAQELGIEQQVLFVPSFTDRQRALLLAACRAVVYTPQHEHFGIVPLEAMASGRPVVACNSGGPTESVRHGETGLLAEPTPAAFADAFAAVLQPKAAAAMGGAARRHVVERFSRASFGATLSTHVQQLAA